MKRFDTNISSTDGTLQQAPEVFQSVSVHAALNIGDRMIYNLMSIVGFHSTVGAHCIGIETGFSPNILSHGFLDKRLSSISNHFATDFSATLQDSPDGLLSFWASRSDTALAFRQVHVACFATDESFIRLDFGAWATEFHNGIVCHRTANAMEHKPCRLLCDSQCTVNLPRANPVLCIDDHPNCGHPLIKTERRIFKDSSYFDSELLFATLAVPEQPCLDERMFVMAATWAQDVSIWPAKIDGIDKCTLRIGEINDGLL